MTEDRSMLSRTAPGPDTVLAYGNHADQVVDILGPEIPAARSSYCCTVASGGRSSTASTCDRWRWRCGTSAFRWQRSSTGVSPASQDLTTGDVRQALESLPDLFETGHEAVVAGHSAGGQLALWALTKPLGGVRGVLALAPVADLVAAERLDLDGGAAVAFLGTAAADRPDLDPARLPTPQVPVTVVHGTADGRVPYAMAELYAANRPGVRVVTLDGVDHFALIDPAAGVAAGGGRAGETRARVTISNRAKALQREPAPTDQVYARLAAEPWSPTDPDGYVNLGTAENHLLFDLLAPRLAAARTVTAADTEYQLMQGMPSFRAELARFLGRQRGVAVDPEHLVVFGGSTGALDAVAYALCDPGDGIVIPTPYYSRLDDVLAGGAARYWFPRRGRPRTASHSPPRWSSGR